MLPLRSKGVLLNASFAEQKATFQKATFQKGNILLQLYADAAVFHLAAVAFQADGARVR